MRLFIALEIPKRSRKLISKKVDILKKNVEQNIKWVSSDKWHITLKFLGKTDKKKIPFIKKYIEKAATNFTRFNLNFNTIGGFPHLNKPRVIYTGINNDRPKAINEFLENLLVKQDFKKDNKKYTPHLTIARSRNNTNTQKLSKNLQKIITSNFINVYMRASKIVLYRSQLLPEGSKYNKLFEANLNK